MSQIFHPSSNSLSRFSIIAFVLFLIFTAISTYGFFQSSYYNHVGVFREQPIPFSHKHHVQGLGLDCRFCHTAVENSATAGMPSTEVCMSCHSQIFKNGDVLKPLHESFEKNRPLQWSKVHNLPDFVFFNHSIHVNKGVSCVTCHGDVKIMPLTSKQKPMTMKWCLECHNNPENYLSPKDQIYKGDETVSKILSVSQRKMLFDSYHIDQSQLNNCYTCHR